MRIKVRARRSYIEPNGPHDLCNRPRFQCLDQGPPISPNVDDPAMAQTQWLTQTALHGLPASIFGSSVRTRTCCPCEKQIAKLEKANQKVKKRTSNKVERR